MITLRLNASEAQALRLYLTTRPERLLKRFGVVFVAQAQKAFKEQRFGAVIWPERYPNQTGDKLNIAGAVEDLKTGTHIKKRRFDARPAGRDTGDLLRRITFMASGDMLEVGANLPYATKFHAGGESTQSITPAVRKNLAKVMKRERKKNRRKAELDADTDATEDLVSMGPKGGVKTVFDRMGFLFQTDTLTTNSPARPFVGITDETTEELERLLKKDLLEYIQGGGSGN